MFELIFDKEGKLICAEEENFSIKYTWDNNRNLLSIKRSDNSFETFKRDKFGKLIEKKYSTGDWIKYDNNKQYSNYGLINENL